MLESTATASNLFIINYFTHGVMSLGCHSHTSARLLQFFQSWPYKLWIHLSERNWRFLKNWHLAHSVSHLCFQGKLYAVKLMHFAAEGYKISSNNLLGQPSQEWLNRGLIFFLKNKMYLKIDQQVLTESRKWIYYCNVKTASEDRNKMYFD